MIYMLPQAEGGNAAKVNMYDPKYTAECAKIKVARINIIFFLIIFINSIIYQLFVSFFAFLLLFSFFFKYIYRIILINYT